MSDAGSTIIFLAVLCIGIYYGVRGYLNSDARLEAQVFGKDVPRSDRPHARSKQSSARANIIYICDCCGEDWTEAGEMRIQRCDGCKKAGRNYRDKEAT